MAEQPGDSREVTIPVSAGNVEVTFNIKSDYTTADDTETNKYFDNISRTADKFALRSSTACQIKSINGIDFTDPITIQANGIYSETGCVDRYGGVAAITVICSTDNTQLKLRIV